MILSLHKYFTHAARAQTQSLRCAHSPRILIQLLKCTRAAVQKVANKYNRDTASHTHTHTNSSARFQ